MKQISADFAVVFDLDGTMVANTSFHEAAWIELCKRHHKPISRQFYRNSLHARSNETIVRKIFGAACPADLIVAIAEEKEQLYREMYGPRVEPVAGLQKLLEQLKQSGIPCAVASNSPQANVDLVLTALKIRDFFTVVVHRGLVRRGKPHPDLFLSAAKGLKMVSQRCLVLEDSATGFAAAASAGMPFVAITAGTAPEDIAKYGAKSSHRNFLDLSVDALRSFVLD